LISVNDKWLRILLPAVPCSLFIYNFLGGEGATFQANLIYILTTIVACEGSRFLIYQSRDWYTPPYRKLKRMALLLPSGILLIALLFFFSKAGRNYLAYGLVDTAANPGVFTFEVGHKRIGTGLIASSFIYGLLTFSLLLAIYEQAHHLARMRHVERQRDRLEKEKLQAELQQLKGIINPHFLFNNLNSLSSLITDDPAQAEAFLDEFTKVFRYLLRNNDTELTTLAQELQFMHSYYHLLQTRYGRAISMEMRIDPAYESYLLPPLTLQLLVENAVKHNRALKEAPLCIELFSDTHHRLFVRNNLALRDKRIESTGIGLRSINSRYSLLNHEPPIVRNEDGFFSVVIPLIPSGVTAAIAPAMA
jgi:two-component system, LytTR family, sensor kinase